jgi:hypothetical protein
MPTVVGLKMRKRDDEFIGCLSTREKALKQLSPNGGGSRREGGGREEENEDEDVEEKLLRNFHTAEE